MTVQYRPPNTSEIRSEPSERSVGLPPLKGEAERLAAVRRFDILDTPPDGSFDRITALAARILDVPVSIITIVDETRIWFKSLYGGVETTEVPREPGLCASAVWQDTPYVVEGARTDPRTRDNSLVTGDLGVQFYAAAPLRTAEGANLGTLCILDDKPRRISEQGLNILAMLAAVVMDELELGLQARRKIRAERELRTSAFHFADATAQRYREHLDTVLTFQRALMPTAFPESERWHFDGTYFPAASLSVGGDWYDVLSVDERRCLISIGDVAGHDLDAAIVMGNVKQSIRVLGSEYAAPEKLLHRLDCVLEQDHPSKVVSIFAGYLDSEKSTLTYANAGHSPPIVRRPDGSVEMLETGGLPLGSSESALRPHRTIKVEPGTLVVLYTDGLSEATRNVLEGEQRICDALRSAEILHAPNRAEAMRAAVIPDGSHDDVAILTILIR